MKPLFTLLVAIFALTQTVGPGHAAMKQIARAESPVVLAVKGIRSDDVHYFYAGWNEDFSQESYGVAYRDRESGVVITAFLHRLAPEYYYSHTGGVTEDHIRSIGFFGGKTLEFTARSGALNAHADTAAAAPNYLLFSADGQSCAYVRALSAMSIQEWKGSGDHYVIHGFFCANLRGTRIMAEEAIAFVTRGVRYIARPPAPQNLQEVELPSIGGR